MIGTSQVRNYRSKTAVVRKAQSAMEYLMTYGWAILIIAVVLAALFELGVFNGSNLAPQACIAQSGFVCKNPIYTSNGISFTFGQTNGRDYYGDWVFVAAQGEALNPNGIPVNFADLPPAHAVPAGGSGNVLIPGQTVQVDFPASDFQAGGVPGNPPIGTPFAGYVWFGYCLSPCTAPTAYSKVATITIKSTAGFTGSTSVSTSTTSSSSSSTTSTTSTTTSTISCTATPDQYGGYNGGCNEVFDASGTLTGDIVTAGSITINNGVTLTTNGHSLIAGAVFDNSGTIDAGTDPGTGGSACQQCNAQPGTSHPASYGGSGGGGSAWWNADLSGQGGNTLVAGGQGPANGGNSAGSPGATPPAPTMSASLVQTCYNNGIQSCLEGGGGGGSTAGTSPSGGADDAYGVFIEAVTLDAGVINTVGGTAGSYNGGAGGGGGGGAIMLVYGSGYAPGTYTMTGGQGGPACSSFGCNGVGGGGNGGDGQLLAYQYSGSPPVPT